MRLGRWARVFWGKLGFATVHAATVAACYSTGPFPLLAAGPLLPGLGEGLISPPPPINRGGPLEEENTKFPRRSSPLLHAPPLPLSSSLPPMWLPLLGAAQVRENSTAARRRAAEIPDLVQKIYFRNSAGPEVRKSSLSTVCVRVLRGAARVALIVVGPASSRPRGRLRRLHQQRLCGSVIPAFRSTRVCFRNSNRYCIANR